TPALEDDLLGACGADEADEAGGGRDAERHAEVDLRDPELRLRGGDPEVAGQRQPQPPPTAWPLTAQRVICSRPSSVVLTRSKSRRNCDLRVAIAWRRSSADIELLSLASAPAEKTGGAPVTITKRTAASSRSSLKARPSSVSM